MYDDLTWRPISQSCFLDAFSKIKQNKTDTVTNYYRLLRNEFSAELEF